MCWRYIKVNVDRFVSKNNINVVEALSKIDKCGYGIIYVVNNHNQLIGAISDGDIRRWIIKTNNLTADSSLFMNKNPKFIFENERDRANDLRIKYPISSLPVLNSNKEIIDIIVFKNNSDLTGKLKCNKILDAPCVIMAGGKGTRLYPYTKILPKPLIPIGDTPILERIFNRFMEFGINKFYLTVNYKKNMIRSYFDDINPNYDIVYIEEDKPLGTAGSIKLIKDKFTHPIIIANCDSLINADYNDLYDFHIKSGNVITVVSSLKNITIPYGVLKTKENGELIEMKEKPKLSYFINTGMYIVNPETITLIPNNQMYHMTNLVQDVKMQGGKVGMYPISEDSFLDMGEFDEMRRMEEKLNIV